MKTVSIFGSTGAIGQMIIDVILASSDSYQVKALVAKSNVQLLAFQAKVVNAEMVVIADVGLYKELKDLLFGTNVKISVGDVGMQMAASLNVDYVMMAIVGIAALVPMVYLISAGVKVIALANKESVVCGGTLLFNLAREKNVNIIPVDSEHNAIFQILHSNDRENIDKITITGSGGALLYMDHDQMRNITVQETIKHPVWKMGKKISIDSATMVNKSLEIIEAYHLFSVKSEKLDVIIHPEAIVHGIVSYVDGACIAFMSVPDMKISIMYTLSWPNRMSMLYKKLNLASYHQLTFMKPDINKFPGIRLGFEILRTSNIHANSIIFNTANEVAVDAFLNRKIGFLDIVNVIYSTLDMVDCLHINSLSDILECDSIARRVASDIICKLN
ncbi:1-deoxy-D-xylulose 5-phosphate reductoisomerase [Ehrlichia ruminantium str. Gardel]|uniref:1-deoxy-D-xylulose 5-phosphate reductoisomerase n=1 Tax=Ehrlichia ruminantium (strain Gardel) TaxID=302409 RepID=DXR_EHRRG|nr:1-deoxy-D-xylulose-5-phosphate reductoisomerase [Ehrlichia ruminantium]Q5FHA4.1 RecName: Full=1-deoxy-D-xylulose 5-phosphate reductoisomerase; Short=DXP reductoisomerase; AltName: Full=1-deoxyxylulose-5-phosphate reductoisomerase; AltName: Full=2-C-methyl-D-erythritol 4-phosphate synthase [Ehrlichia ruminantium str. Gardel]CAI27939.1 1-deoxy-D-xylulose 5-phosphate reductoisomerase [Ehrlichia ruminantium str. Gardel]